MICAPRVEQQASAGGGERNGRERREDGADDRHRGTRVEYVPVAYQAASALSQPRKRQSRLVRKVRMSMCGEPLVVGIKRGHDAFLVVNANSSSDTADNYEPDSRNVAGWRCAVPNDALDGCVAGGRRRI